MPSAGFLVKFLLVVGSVAASPTLRRRNHLNVLPRQSTGTTCGSISVESQEQVTCNEYMPPAYIGAGATYIHSTTKTVGTTWSVGGDLGLNIGDLSSPAGSAGFSIGFSETTTVGDTTGSSEVCGMAGGNYTCGMDVQPKCWHMVGTCHDAYSMIESGFSEAPPTVQELGDLPWDTTVPVTDDGDSSQGVYTQNLCTCQNCLGWADGGHPGNLCPLDCQTCDTPAGGI